MTHSAVPSTGLTRIMRKFYDKEYGTQRWHELRYRIWIKFNKRCALCGDAIFDDEFHLDHIKEVPWEFDPDFDFYNEDNLQPLHVHCHSVKTNKGRVHDNPVKLDHRPKKKRPSG